MNILAKSDGITWQANPTKADDITLEADDITLKAMHISSDLVKADGINVKAKPSDDGGHNLEGEPHLEYLGEG